MLDKVAAELFAKNINMMVPWYLMASYAYYKEDNSIFTDGFFDDMGKTMLACWDDIDHFHKDYISKGDLEAGTFLGKYPTRVEGALKSLREKYYTKSGTLRKTPKLT
tara:strand:+ start:9012 stop:9332 length:321 start_codon:yes stop_codon:yes gene_type:complete